MMVSYILDFIMFLFFKVLRVFLILDVYSHINIILLHNFTTEEEKKFNQYAQ